jgi:hypothetical protein
MASRGPFPVEGIPRRNLRRSITALPFVSITGFSDGDGGASNRRQNMVPATDAPLDICSLQSHSSGLFRAVEPNTKMNALIEAAVALSRSKSNTERSEPGFRSAYLISTLSASELEAQVACIASDGTNGQYRT